MTIIKRTDRWEPSERGPAVPKTATLYNSHIATVEEFGRLEKRSFSNALQVIIEQWYDCVGADVLNAPEPQS